MNWMTIGLKKMMKIKKKKNRTFFFPLFGGGEDDEDEEMDFSRWMMDDDGVALRSREVKGEAVFLGGLNAHY